MHIAVAGNIGAGKTALTTCLSEYFKWKPHYEEVIQNPYLEDFYQDMERWSFNLQIFFLNSRFQQVNDIRQTGLHVIQDRTIYEDAKIFAPNLYEMGLMSSRDFENYISLFQLMESLVKPPDLLIYLRSTIDTLQKQIQKRGRSYEQSIDQSYLEGLNQRYEKWINSYDTGNLLVIDADNLDFVNHFPDRKYIIDKISNFIENTTENRPYQKIVL